MILVKQVKVDAHNNSHEKIEHALIRKLKINNNDLINFKINKESIDARNKNEIFFVYELIVEINNENKYLNNKDVSLYKEEKYEFNITGAEKISTDIIVVGSGPSGLFATYNLVKNGYKVTLIEQGEDVDSRKRSVEMFWKENKLNEKSNVQFGEGGAGTFSDGKLNTLKKDENYRQKYVYETFVKFGAPEEILYSYKPHIGTDVLCKVVKNMREDIIRLGGIVLFNTKLTNLIIENSSLKAIEINNTEIIKCEHLILAIGHSARDTFKMLYENNIVMESKPFAVGYRVQHKQSMIDESQYGKKYVKVLNKATYKLTYKASNGLGVYSFCMCPGGYVVNASSSNGLLAVNGMSNFERESENANSAIVVTVDKSIYGDGLFAGMHFQEKLEKSAFNLGNGLIPIQLLKDFKMNKISTGFGNIKPVFKGSYQFANLKELLPTKLNDSIEEAFVDFDKKIAGFACDDTILAGIESRTSSPIRIIRDESFQSNIKGVYPIGEGAGYAGGITTSAIDGIKLSEIIAKQYKN